MTRLRNTKPHVKRRRKSKYNNRKTIVNGITFDSKLEAKRYHELLLMRKAGAISDLELQKRFILQEGYTNGDGRKIRPIHYICDFYYFDCQSKKMVVEDVKGQKTQVYLLKKKMFEKAFSPLVISEIY